MSSRTSTPSPTHPPPLSQLFAPDTQHSAPGISPFALCAYNAGLALSWPLLLSYYRLRVRTDGKYGGIYRQRMGLELPCPASGPRVWVHALSLGETLSAVPLVKGLKAWRPEADILFSTSTETGQAIARKRLSEWVEQFFILPHDFPWSMRSVVRSLRPELFLLVETDIWPNLLSVLGRYGIPRVLVNGRVSERSFKRLLRARPLIAPLFGSFELIFAQSQDDKGRYEALGVAPQRVQACGNFKFDSLGGRLSETARAALRAEAGIEANRPVWICGSTHEGEEEALLEVHRDLGRTIPRLLLILAPRDVGRARHLQALCRRFGLSCAVRSTGEPAAGMSVYLLDTLGELGRFYALAAVAFIGGSLVPFGGHNPLEAVVQERPTLWGPHLSNFREMERDLLLAGCGAVITGGEALREKLRGWLGDAGLQERMQEAARGFVTTHSGVTQRMIGCLSKQNLKLGRTMPCRRMPHHTPNS